MNAVLIRLGLVINVMQRFGVLPGLRLVVQILRGRGTFQVNVPGYPHPIHLRSSEKDAAMLYSVLVDDEYYCEDYTSTPETIVDAGGNIGFTTLYFARRYPHAKILTIEPHSGNLEMLRKNLAPYPNVEIFEGAVWPSKTPLHITNPNDVQYLFRVEESADSTTTSLSVITMPEILERMGGHIDLLKLDIEGAERELFLADDLTWLDEVDAMAIEVHDRFAPGASKAMFNALSKYNFNQFMDGMASYIIKT